LNFIYAKTIGCLVILLKGLQRVGHPEQKLPALLRIQGLFQHSRKQQQRLLMLLNGLQVKYHLQKPVDALIVPLLIRDREQLVQHPYAGIHLARVDIDTRASQLPFKCIGPGRRRAQPFHQARRGLQVAGLQCFVNQPVAYYRRKITGIRVARRIEVESSYQRLAVG